MAFAGQSSLVNCMVPFPHMLCLVRRHSCCRRVMENIEAMGHANGHLLLPICPAQDDFEIHPCETDEPNDEDATDTSEAMVSPAHHSDESAAVPESHALPAMEDRRDLKPSVPCQPINNRRRISEGNRKRSFQTILQNTKNGIVDVAEHKDDLIQDLWNYWKPD